MMCGLRDSIQWRMLARMIPRQLRPFSLIFVSLLLQHGWPAQVKADEARRWQPIIAAQHTVAAGETLADVAKRYQVTPDLLRFINSLKTDEPQPGQVLAIPDPELLCAFREVHEVRAEETLSAIARRHQIMVESLRTANGLTGDVIQAGQQLVILEPPGRDHNPYGDELHEAAPGETLSGISRRWKVPVAAIQKVNLLGGGDGIQPGQVLLIPVAEARKSGAAAKAVKR